jgi:3-methyladenine DNA glycosylase Mpg
MHITPLLNGSSFLTGPLKIVSADTFGGEFSSGEIIAAARIGIVKGKEALLRFYLQGNRFVSNKPLSNAFPGRDRASTHLTSGNTHQVLA